MVRVTREPASYPIFRHNGRFAEMVSADVAGRFEAPVYGMLAVEDALKGVDWGAGRSPTIKYHGQPSTIPSRRCSGTANGRLPM